MTWSAKNGQRPDAVTLIAVYFFATGGLSLLGALFGLAFGGDGRSCLPGNLCGLVQFLSFPLAMAALVGSGLLYGIIALVTGWGLLNLYPWARSIAMVLAVLTLFSFPFGTVIGALIIWYLLKRDVSVLFQA